MDNKYALSPSQCVFSRRPDGSYGAGGFPVKNVLMELGLSPMSTSNNSPNADSASRVSELYSGALGIPMCFLNVDKATGGDSAPSMQAESQFELVPTGLYSSLLDLAQHNRSQRASSRGTRRRTTTCRSEMRSRSCRPRRCAICRRSLSCSWRCRSSAAPSWSAIDAAFKTASGVI